MKLEYERVYLNTFLIWGARQYDPANTEHIKSFHTKRIISHRIMPKKPTSRYLSTHVSDYQM
jgi:hypothetical protein